MQSVLYLCFHIEVLYVLIESGERTWEASGEASESHCRAKRYADVMEVARGTNRVWGMFRI